MTWKVVGASMVSFLTGVLLVRLVGEKNVIFHNDKGSSSVSRSSNFSHGEQMKNDQKSENVDDSTWESLSPSAATREVEKYDHDYYDWVSHLNDYSGVWRFPLNGGSFTLGNRVIEFGKITPDEISELRGKRFLIGPTKDWLCGNKIFALKFIDDQGEVMRLFVQDYNEGTFYEGYELHKDQ